MNLRLGPRHALVALVVIVLAGLAGAGCVGPAVGRERIHAFDVTAVVREDRRVEVREVIDWDFGPSSKRGIFRLIPSDGGVPEDINVTSPDAPDQFVVSAQGTDTEIRIGDPAVTISGRHRYVITYTLPDTIVDGRFALDAVGTTWPVAVEEADVTILGAELESPRCFTGVVGSTDRCDVALVDDGYRVHVERLGQGEGITIDGDLTRTRPAAFGPLPPFDERDSGAAARWAAIVGGLAALVAVAGFVWARQVGRNEVAAGGATEAAFVPYGTESFGPQHEMPAAAPPALPGARLVADTKMGELAGLEFVPPGGVEPWQSSVVLREDIDDRTIGAWFSGLAAHDIVTLEGTGDDVVMAAGPALRSADRTTQAVLGQALGRRGAIALGSYDAGFAAAWQEAGTLISQWVASSQVFRRRPPRFGGGSSLQSRRLGGGTVVVSGGGLGFLPCLILPVLLVLGGGAASIGGLRTAFGAVAVALAISAVAAWLAYRGLTRSLSARGSAIALRSESFRRFLHDSEAQHVEWAWENGLLREYSAWAVALGEADAWNQAMSTSSIPPPELASSYGVMMPVFYASSFTSAMTAPAPAGGGGFGSSGGGFSGGGFSGGGGGGGGGGSW